LAPDLSGQAIDATPAAIAAACAQSIAARFAALGPAPSRVPRAAAESELPLGAAQGFTARPLLPCVDGFATWLDTFSELLKNGRRGKRLPLILQDLIDRVLGFYARPKELFRTLAHVNSGRQMRSERRCAVLAVLLCLIHDMDVVTLKVGKPTPDGFVYHLTMKRIADRTGLTLRRVYRAMSDLSRAGLVTVTRQFRKAEDGAITNLPAVRTVSRLFFDVLGLGEAYDRERRRAHQRRQEAHAEARKRARPTRRDQAHWKLELARTLARVKSYQSRRNVDQPPTVVDAVAHRRATDGPLS
jgi:DNA-binding transcriptional ArsR family regulator